MGSVQAFTESLSPEKHAKKIPESPEKPHAQHASEPFPKVHEVKIKEEPQEPCTPKGRMRQYLDDMTPPQLASVARRIPGAGLVFPRRSTGPGVAVPKAVPAKSVKQELPPAGEAGKPALKSTKSEFEPKIKRAKIEKTQIKQEMKEEHVEPAVCVQLVQDDGDDPWIFFSPFMIFHFQYSMDKFQGLESPGTRYMA